MLLKSTINHEIVRAHIVDSRFYILLSTAWVNRCWLEKGIFVRRFIPFFFVLTFLPTTDSQNIKYNGKERFRFVVCEIHDASFLNIKSWVNRYMPHRQYSLRQHTVVGIVEKYLYTILRILRGTNTQLLSIIYVIRLYNMGGLLFLVALLEPKKERERDIFRFWIELIGAFR